MWNLAAGPRLTCGKAQPSMTRTGDWFWTEGPSGVFAEFCPAEWFWPPLLCSPSWGISRHLQSL